MHSNDNYLRFGPGSATVAPVDERAASRPLRSTGVQAYLDGKQKLSRKLGWIQDFFAEKEAQGSERVAGHRICPAKY